MAVSPTPLTPLEVRQKTFAEFLISGFPGLDLPGLPMVSACAVCGNGTQENAMNAITIGPKDEGSDGVMQWRLQRLANMQSWCVIHFKQWGVLQAQAAFFLYETKNFYPGLWADLVAGKKSLATLTANVCNVYEDPNRAEANLGFIPGSQSSGKVGRINYAYDVQALLAASKQPVINTKVAVSTGTVVAATVAVAASSHAFGGPLWLTVGITVAGLVVMAVIARYMIVKNTTKPTLPSTLNVLAPPPPSTKP